MVLSNQQRKINYEETNFQYNNCCALLCTNNFNITICIMKTIKEQYKEIVCGWNEERTDNVANRCTEIAEEFAIEFALFLSENMYENMYNDINKDGKTWVSYLQDGFHEHTQAERFTIQEILEIFKKEKGL